MELKKIPLWHPTFLGPNLKINVWNSNLTHLHSYIFFVFYMAWHKNMNDAAQ